MLSWSYLELYGDPSVYPATFCTTNPFRGLRLESRVSDCTFPIFVSFVYLSCVSCVVARMPVTFPSVFVMSPFSLLDRYL